MLSLIPQFILEKQTKEITYGNFNAVTLFQDISGFTLMTEKLMERGKVGAEVLSLIINQVFEILIRIIYQNDGYISTFAGDAFTAIFPSGDIEKACKAALGIQQYFNENPIKKTQLGDFTMAVKQGLSYGKVDWGVVGGEQYKAFYFRGEAVDGCARSEHHSGKGEIVIDSRVLEKLPQSNISLKEKAVYYYLLEEKAFHEINWDEINILEPFSDEKDNADIKLMNHSITKYFFPALDQKESLKSDFRDLVSMFLSFEEPKTFEKLDMLVTKVLRLAKDFGGYLSSLDFGDKGSIMLFLFGAPIAYEDNSLRAADFASSIKSIFGDKIRVGITFGTAFAGYVGSADRITYTALGDAINLSARFMSEAKNGQILISKKVSNAIEREFETKLLDKKKFKGKSEEIDVYELMAKIHFEDKGLHTGHFVGRQEEIKALNQFCEPFLANKFAHFICIYGDVGVGKSRLLFEFTNPLIGDEDGKASIIVLQTDGILKKSLNPFTTHFFEFFDISQTFSEEEKKKRFDQKLEEILNNPVLKGKLDKNDERAHDLVRQLRDEASILAALLGIHWKGSLYEELESRERFRKFLSIIKCFFLIQAILHPLILVLEDAYDVDEDSKKAFDLLVEDIEDIPLIIFASCRLDDNGGETEFLTKNGAKKIVLAPLAEQESRDLIESLLNKKVHADLFTFVIEKTENNPLYIEEFCGYLLERKLIKEKDDQYILTSKITDIPESIKSIIVSRIDRLPPDLKEIVQIAAVLGREFNIKILAKLAQEVPTRLALLLEKGVEQKIWEKVNDTYYQFIQSMTQSSVYSMQLTEDLKITHKKAAEFLEEYYKGSPSKFASIAYHFEVAQIKVKTIHYLFEASQVSHANYRFDEAMESYNKLLIYLDESGEKINVYGRMAEINEHNGLWHKSYQLLAKGIRLAQKTGAELQGANLKAYMGEILQKKSMLKKASGILNEAITLASIYSDDIVLAKAYLNLGKVKIDEGNYDEAMVYLKRAYSAKNHDNDEVGKGLCLYYMGVTQREQSKFDVAIKYYEKSQKVFQITQNRRYESYPIYDMGIIHQHWGDLKQAEKSFESCATLYKEIAYPSGESGALLNLGIIYSMRNEHDRSLAILNKALTIVKKNREDIAISYTFFAMGATYYRMNNYKQAIQYFRQSLELMKKIEMTKYYGYIFSYLSCIYVDLNKTTQAIKTAYSHVKNMKQIKTDVENGRTYLGVATALSKSPQLSQISKKRLSVIAAYTNIIEEEKKESAQTYFQIAIKTAEEANYPNTLIPSLFLYAEYLVKKGDKKEAKKYISKAQKKAEGLSFISYVKRIEQIKKTLLI